VRCGRSRKKPSTDATVVHSFCGCSVCIRSGCMVCVGSSRELFHARWIHPRLRDVTRQRLLTAEIASSHRALALLREDIKQCFALARGRSSVEVVKTEGAMSRSCEMRCDTLRFFFVEAQEVRKEGASGAARMKFVCDDLGSRTCDRLPMQQRR